MFWFWKKRPKPPLVQRRWKWSKRISFWVHSIIVSTVVMELLMVALPMPVEPPAQQVVLQAPPLAEPPAPPPVEINAFPPYPENWLANDSVDISHLEAAQTDPRWTTLTETDLAARPGEELAAASSFLNERLMQSIKDAEERSDEDNLERLRKLAAQQNNISTQESVADITAQLNKFLGTTARATEPAKEPVGGEFDFDTGQLHDYRRERLENGTFKYTAVLIDSAGRTFETEMPAAEGESAYKTFELMKQNPLLERVYRGVVMSLLDKVINPK
jgi:hypothetical protein